MSIIRLTLLALVACVPLLAQAAPYQLTTAWPVNVGPLNPHLYTPNQMFAQSMVYEPLVKYQADGNVQPWLATRWRHSADGKTWWFTLRDDVAFSNGEPFNAQAAAANFQAVLANRQRHAWLELANQITDVRALSATELQITLKSAYAPLLQELALPPPVPLHRPLAVYRWRHRRGIKAPIGTGPWRLASSQLNQRDVLVRNERYWGRKPALQQITIKVIPDATSRAVAFETRGNRYALRR
ncbi:ABC transporter substrate-binding protein [Klebsiella pneumoniae subsp. pneumoniae]|nr:ABC transporter substrate-binding protein [Klebsiella pneumoniae subsp. pneumoniae]